ncbi:hypothetical protein FH972_026276 [Carpinus fangiana]|uniref:Uncharacterized protein n=1 Tax=Carpinus fangiana TaxID=176857 RepID=A0A5N6L3W2_9ROSI|nr:hypothetical protein FH972_026276 [Carpinus fangiana]
MVDPFINVSLANSGQFDKLAVGSTPSPGFAFVNWTNFVVQPASTFQVTPHSAPNVVLADGFRSSLSFSPTGPRPNQAFAILRSFSFACVVPYPEGSWLPVSCDIVLVREGTYPVQQVASFGPYSFFANYSMPAGTFPMQNVALANVETTPGAGGVEGTNLFFYVTKTSSAGPGGSGVSIVLDDMVLAKYNNCGH